MLELKRMSVGYAGRYLIPNVNLSFAPGKIYGIIGKNGSGKSGLLKVCSGQEIPETGSVTLDGKPLSSFSIQELQRQIGFLTQDRPMTMMPARRVVARNLPQGVSRFGGITLEQRRRVYSCLGVMRASGLGAIPMNRLSRGERHRVFLAALLARDPQIFLLDEPFSDLDVEYRQLLVQTLLRLKSEGKTVIMALQDLKLAMQYCDELVVIDIGREVHTGTPDQIRQQKILEKIFRISNPV